MITPHLTKLARFPVLAICLAVLLCGAPAVTRAQGTPTRAAAANTLVAVGQEAMRRNEDDKAAALFSRALAIVPTDLRAQLGLAEVFYRQGRPGRAEAYLRHLLNDPAQIRNEAAYLEGLAVLQKRRPLVFAGSFALLPSTNINNASSEDTFSTLLGNFNISNSEKQSGVGVDLGGIATYRHPLGQGRSLVVRGSLRHIWYSEESQQHWRGRIGVDLRQAGALRDWSVGLYADWLNFPHQQGQTNDRVSYGLRASWAQEGGTGRRYFVNGVLEHRDYADKSSLTGPYAAVSLGFAQPLTERDVFSLRTTLERARPKRDYHRYWGIGLRLSYDRPLSETIRAGISGSAMLRRYDTDFSSVDYPRQDEIYSIGLSISDRRIKIMDATPRLSCTYEIRQSNIALYSTDSTDCRIGWSYTF